MKPVTAYWEDQYVKNESLWGLQPDYRLVQYGRLAPPGKVLDLGAGEGRNVLWLAAFGGYEAEGVELSAAAIERCRANGERYGVPVRMHQADLRTFPVQEEAYSCIIAANSLNFMAKSELLQLLPRLKAGVKPGGLLYLSLFSQLDPKYAVFKETLEPCGEDTFYLESLQGPVCFPHRREIGEWFEDFETLCFSEALEWDNGHGEPHYHGIAEYIGRKKGNEEEKR